MSKVAKTIKISLHHEAWLKSQNLNFSEWIREKLDEEMGRRHVGKHDHKYRAVILAAGKDKNLFPLTEEIPKTMLDVKGKTILQRQVEMLHHAGVFEIAVVRGYQKHRINYPDLRYFDNDDFLQSGSLVSLFAARDFVGGETLVLYGDILFESGILPSLLDTKDRTTLVVDRGWKKHYQASLEGHPFPPELTNLSEKGKEIKIEAVGVGLPETGSTSEFIGLAKLSSKACSTLIDVYKNMYEKDPQQPFHQAGSIKKASFIDFVKELLNRGEQVSGLEIWRTWIDIDTFEDYRNAWKIFNETNGIEK
jgi:phosphoenolpyruvate phosphomutase